MPSIAAERVQPIPTKEAAIACRLKPFEAGRPQDGEGEVEIRQCYEMDEVPGAAE